MDIPFPQQYRIWPYAFGVIMGLMVAMAYAYGRM